MRGIPLLRSLLLVASACSYTGCGSDEQLTPNRADVDLVVAAKPVSMSKVAPPQIELTVGEQFHYIKAVEQWLSRPSRAGSESLGDETVKMLITLTVQEVRPDRVLVGVAYRQVQYEYEFAGRKIVYSSADQGASVPAEARPYAGLVDNGFGIWIGKSNRLLDAVDVDAFLQRCLSLYPPGETAELLQTMGGFAGSAEDRVMAARSFLDESIALLPFGELRQGNDYFPTGATWSRNVRPSARADMMQKLQLKLDYIEDDKAHIIIGGMLQPDDDRAVVTPEGMRLSLSGGRITGSCEVNLLNGLPGSSRILREFQLEATPLNQPAVTLNKTVETRFDPWTPASSP